MRKIKRAIYNVDTASVEIYFNDLTTIRLYTPEIEKSLHTTIYTRSQFQLLADTNPLEYARLILSGEMQNYLDLLKEENRSISNDIRLQLKERYPDMSDTQIDSLVREYRMYNK